MKVLNQYTIPLTGMAQGSHKFDMTVDDKVFNYYESPVAKNGEVVAHITLLKKSGFYEIETNLEGWLELNCDRYLSKYQEKVKNNFNLILKHSEKEGEHMQGEVELKFISPDCTQFNFGKDLFEYISISLPMKKCCKSNSCSDLLEKYKSSKKEDMVDPRWKELTKLK